MTRAPQRQPRPLGSESPNATADYTALQLPSGRLLPIEVRLGRRVLRVIAPESEEGRRLLASGRVKILRPDTTNGPL